jgi:hypothetical protein
MDLASSVSGLLEAFSNAEDVDRFNRSGGDLGIPLPSFIHALKGC